MFARRRNVMWTVPLLAAGLLSAGPFAAPSGAEPAPGPTVAPWQVRHWPQTQPWQRPQSHRGLPAAVPRPIDPQDYELPDTMTWDDYRTIPGTNWADPSVTGSVKTFRGALVLADYPGQPFVITQPANSSVYGNPTTVHDIPRAEVPAFYRDFLNQPGTLNHGHTLHEYWMEDSGGRYGIELAAFGVYRMPAESYEYGIEQSMQRLPEWELADLRSRRA